MRCALLGLLLTLTIVSTNAQQPVQPGRNSFNISTDRQYAEIVSVGVTYRAATADLGFTSERVTHGSGDMYLWEVAGKHYAVGFYANIRQRFPQMFDIIEVRAPYTKAKIVLKKFYKDDLLLIVQMPPGANVEGAAKILRPDLQQNSLLSARSRSLGGRNAFQNPTADTADKPLMLIGISSTGEGLKWDAPQTPLPLLVDFVSKRFAEADLLVKNKN